MRAFRPERRKDRSQCRNVWHRAAEAPGGISAAFSGQEKTRTPSETARALSPKHPKRSELQMKVVPFLNH